MKALLYICILLLLRPAFANMAPLKTQIDILVQENPIVTNLAQAIDGYAKDLATRRNQAKDGYSLFGKERELGFIWQNKLTCSTCRYVTDWFDDIIVFKPFRYTFEKGISLLCTAFVDYRVCSGAVEAMAEVILPQLASGIFGPEYGCSRMLGFCSDPNFKTLDPQDYIDRVLSDKPEIISDNDYINKKYEMISQDPKERKTVSILHITDVHLDFDYTEGMNAKCNEPLCCREINGPPKHPENAAGKYGDYNCDLPPIVAEMMIEYVKELPDQPDFIFWTGDNIAHDIWNQSSHKNAEYTIQMTNWLQKHYADIPVFTTPGNHEFYPVNVMTFDEVDPLFEMLGGVWRNWLDDQAYESFINYGFYSMPLKGIAEDWNGFRVMVLNTGVCNNMNWYLLTQLNDPLQHLEWIEDTLRQAEENNEKVYIISHVFPGGADCLYEWSVRYRAIVERYQHVILHHFVGHDHVEFFNIITDTKNQDDIGMMQAPGGVTTFTDDNPAFKIYEIDYETGLPVRGHKHFFNITEANLGNPRWQYDFEQTEEYAMADLSPRSFRDLTERFLTEEGTATKYFKNKYTRSDTLGKGDCETEKCKKEMACKTGNFIHFEERDCLGEKRIDYIHDFTDSLFETMFDPWVIAQ
ncbi:unnamed protein product [Moneuplotes crassus]|uniref:Sphingomyelin phosphodiesterase n=1 Tax=Euplotes crassus TaxID=5936 RepID=A0AAD1X6W5_EUPCR|nr:unnamed protein product [Moneuplotes crassus]